MSDQKQKGSMQKPFSRQGETTPRLRFPEFRNAGPWEVSVLGKHCSITTGKLDANAMVDNGQYRFYTCAKEYYFIDKYAFDTEALLISGNGANVGYIHYYKGKFNAYQRTYVLDEFDQNIIFLKYFLEKNLHKRISTEKKDGNTPYIVMSTLTEMKVLLPSLPEQQKIADCLSSLDEVIALQTKKLEALKRHKKGLMQQLFPAEGETTPRLRFPEFRDAGPWEVKRLGEYLVRKPEYGVNAPAVPYSDNLPTYLRITDISEDGKYLKGNKVSVGVDIDKEMYLSEGDIVFARTGASVGKSYKHRKEDGNLVFAGFLVRIRPNPKRLNSEFLFQYLYTDRYWHWVDYNSARSGQPGINGSQYASMPIPVPPTLPEQQKIADCLSSLDEVIALQTKKLEALKRHKKGLMQQLFPQEVG